jgi:hypothetical protein
MSLKALFQIYPAALHKNKELLKLARSGVYTSGLKEVSACSECGAINLKLLYKNVFIHNCKSYSLPRNCEREQNHCG